RHTRFSRDWSSDVCSSDLGGQLAVDQTDEDERRTEDVKDDGGNRARRNTKLAAEPETDGGDQENGNDILGEDVDDGFHAVLALEIGRASCRERGWSWAAGG